MKTLSSRISRQKRSGKQETLRRDTRSVSLRISSRKGQRQAGKQLGTKAVSISTLHSGGCCNKNESKVDNHVKILGEFIDGLRDLIQTFHRPAKRGK